MTIQYKVLQPHDLQVSRSHQEFALDTLLGLSKSTKIDVVLSLGYPAEDAEPRPKKRKSLDEIRTYYKD